MNLSAVLMEMRFFLFDIIQEMNSKDFVRHSFKSDQFRTSCLKVVELGDLTTISTSLLMLYQQKLRFVDLFELFVNVIEENTLT